MKQTKTMNQVKTAADKDIVWPIRMKMDFKVKFKTFCDDHGCSMNKRVKLLMQQDMDRNKI